VTLRFLGATYQIPVQQGTGTTSTVERRINWRIGFLRLTHAKLVLDRDFEIQSGELTGSVRLGPGLTLDKATIRFKGSGEWSPRIHAGQLRLGRHASVSVKDLIIHQGGAVSGEFKGKLSKGHKLLRGAIVLEPGAWLAGTLHHNALSGLHGGGAGLRVDKLDMDLTIPNFNFGTRDRGRSWNWPNLWKYFTFPKIKLPRLTWEKKKGKSKIRFVFEDPHASFVDNVLTVGGRAKMLFGKRSIGVDVVAEVSRSGVKVRVGPQLQLPKIQIPLTRGWSFWRPRTKSGLYPLVPERKIGRKGSRIGLSIGAGFGFEVQPTSLEAFVKLTPPRLRGGFELPGIELHAGKVPSPHRMFKAKLRLRAQAGAGVSLPGGAGHLKLLGKGNVFTQLGVNPTLRAHLSTAKGVISGGVKGRLRLSGDIDAKLGLDLVLQLFQSIYTKSIWSGGLKMRRPIGWSPSFNFDFGQLGPDDIGDRPLVKEEHFNSLAKDFDSAKRNRSPKTHAATTHLDRVQRIVEVVLTAVEILTPLNDAIDHLKAGNFLAAARAAAMSPEKLFNACMKFYALVDRSSRDGTFKWMEKFLPGGRQAVRFLRGYLSAVTTTSKGIAFLGKHLLGREDPYETARRIRREVYQDNAAAIKATRAERSLMARGADPISARRVGYLTWKRHTPMHANEYQGWELFEIRRKLEEKLPNAWAAQNRKREELVRRGIPRDIAHEIACIYRLAFVNSTGDSWQYVKLAKSWERSAMDLAMTMMGPADPRHFQGLIKGWVAAHQPKRRKVEKGIL
jgi:hypothetical protein